MALMTQGVQYMVKFKDNKFSKDLRKMNTGLKKNDKQAKKLNNSFGKIRNSIIGMAAAFGAIQFGRGIIDATAEFQKFEAVLTNTFGSNSEALASMDMIQEFAAKTPFQVDKLTESYVKLVNRGFKPTEDELTRLGDLASSTAKPFDQLVEAILDAETGEFERLKEFGVKAKVAGDEVTFAFKGVETTVNKSNEAIREYVLGLGELEGVSGAMASISGTLEGQMSNLGDKFLQLQLSIGTKMAPAVSKIIEIMGMLIEKVTSNTAFFTVLNEKILQFVQSTMNAVKWIRENWEAIKEWSIAIGTFIVVFQGLLPFVGVLFSIVKAMRAVTIAQGLLNVVMLANPVFAVTAAIAALVAGVVYAYRNFDKFREIADGLWSSLKRIGTNLLSWFKSPLENLSKLLTKTLAPFLEAMTLFSQGEFKKAGIALLQGFGGLTPAGIAANALGDGVGDAFSKGAADSRFDTQINRMSEKAKKLDDRRDAALNASQFMADRNNISGDVTSVLNGGVSTTDASKSASLSMSGSGKGGGTTIQIGNLLNVEKLVTEDNVDMIMDKLKIGLQGVINDVSNSR